MLAKTSSASPPLQSDRRTSDWPASSEDAALKRDRNNLEGKQSATHKRATRVQQQAREFIRICFDETGTMSLAQKQFYEGWFSQMEITDEGINNVTSREEFLAGKGREMKQSALSLRQEFEAKITEAYNAKYISEQSMKKWISRFRSKNTDYLAKEYWVKRQLPTFFSNWRRVKEEWKIVTDNPTCKLLTSKELNIDSVRDEKKFLELSYDERVNILAKARAAMHAHEKDRLGLYARAKSILTKAAYRDRVLSETKVGSWLERIFKAGTRAEKIEKFLSESDGNTIFTLIKNWTEVKQEYDKVVEQVKRRGRNRAWGLTIPSPDQFLNMHYAQRTACVQEMKNRLTEANAAWGIRGTPEESTRDPEVVFLKIRHDLDIEDWESADEEIQHAEGLTLTDAQHKRLKSMKQNLVHFRTDGQVTGMKASADAQKIKEARLTIARALQELQPEIRLIVKNLLKAPHMNRSIHQLRWIWYNYIWCLRNHYMDRDKARHGASRKNLENTRIRGDHGQRIGLNDVMDERTAGQQYIEKDENAMYKPTCLHVNIASEGARTNLEKYLLREHNSKALYWTTLTLNRNGSPFTEAQMYVGLEALNQIRSATRTLERTGVGPS